MPPTVGSWTDAREHAAARVVVAGDADATARLAANIATVGLARIHGIQRSLGEEADARLLVAPDATPSGNPERGAAGFASGTRIWWSSARPFLPLDFGPNACGLCVAGIESDGTDGPAIWARLIDLERDPPVVDGIPITLDLGRRNHFVGVFDCASNVLPYDRVAIVHCSAPELKASRSRGSLAPPPGQVQTASSPAGAIRYVVDDDAVGHLAAFRRAEQFAASKRQAIVTALFPGARILTNAVHQGYESLSEILIGSHSRQSTGPYPFLLGFGAASYLFEPATLTADMPEPLANVVGAGRLLPHGGGAEYDFLADSSVTVEPNGRIRMTLVSTRGGVTELRHTADLPYTYRGEASWEAVQRAGLVRPVATLEPKICLRI